MDQYKCRKCGQILDPKKGSKVRQFTDAGGEKLVIRCPACKTENAFQVPPK